MAKLLKNTTGFPIDLKEVGAQIAPSSTFTIDPAKYQYYAKAESIAEITPLINSGDIIVIDNTLEITVANGLDLNRAIDFLRYPDTAFNGRFLSDPERSNGFVSKNIQEAIEEAKAGGDSVQGRTFNVPFYNNGNTANKWLFHIPTSDATDALPYNCYWDVEIFGVSFSNKNTNINCDIEVYVGGLAPSNQVYTMLVRDFKNSHETILTSLFTADIGDGISVFVKKMGNLTPSSVEVNLNLRIRNNNVGIGGSN